MCRIQTQASRGATTELSLRDAATVQLSKKVSHLLCTSPAASEYPAVYSIIYNRAAPRDRNQLLTIDGATAKRKGERHQYMFPVYCSVLQRPYTGNHVKKTQPYAVAFVFY